jgi:sRNA-binding protein
MEQLTEAAKKIAVSATGGADSTSQEASSAPSKKALKKAVKEQQKAEEKEKKKAEKEAREAEENERKKREEATDVSKGKYGVLPLIQSTTRTGKSLLVEIWS